MHRHHSSEESKRWILRTAMQMNLNPDWLFDGREMAGAATWGCRTDRFSCMVQKDRRGAFAQLG